MIAAAPVIVWFRQDLRLADNPALLEAVKQGTPVIPVFIWAPQEEISPIDSQIEPMNLKSADRSAAGCNAFPLGSKAKRGGPRERMSLEKKPYEDREPADWAPGAASRWWLHHSLFSLDNILRTIGSKLVIQQGNSSEQLLQIATRYKASAVYFDRRYEPFAVARDHDVAQNLSRAGIRVHTFNGNLLFEPGQIKNKAGEAFRVFSPFWRVCLNSAKIPEPLRAPARLTAPQRWPDTLPLEALQLEPKIDWAGGIKAHWEPGEAGAQKRLNSFLRDGLQNYEATRDYPAEEGTSKLSPHLHFGEISPRQIWYAVREKLEAKSKSSSWINSVFLAELGWREFGYNLLFHFPHTPTEPLRPEFSRFSWMKNERWLRAWQKGQTGYPIVDAGMRQLWQIGWMHNRVRMIVGSFLVKDLLLPWQEGERWFWDTLVDADLASNTLGWQWVAGSGADAMPYFRIFNPVTQGEKFDKSGSYVRKWVPELAQMPEEWIHHPWEAPSDVLRKAGVDLGKTYPKPIISHAIAREVALEAYQKVKP